jgi:hypothetical protein
VSVDHRREPELHPLPTHVGVAQPLLRLGPLRLDVSAVCKLAVGGLVAARVWDVPGLPLPLRLAGLAVVAGVTLAFTTARPGGRPLEAWVVPIGAYLLRPRLFVWRARGAGHPWRVAEASRSAATGEDGWYRLAAIRVRWAAPGDGRSG